MRARALGPPHHLALIGEPDIMRTILRFESPREMTDERCRVRTEFVPSGTQSPSREARGAEVHTICSVSLVGIKLRMREYFRVSPMGLET